MAQGACINPCPSKRGFREAPKLGGDYSAGAKKVKEQQECSINVVCKPPSQFSRLKTQPRGRVCCWFVGRQVCVEFKGKLQPADGRCKPHAQTVSDARHTEVKG